MSDFQLKRALYTHFGSDLFKDREVTEHWYSSGSAVQLPVGIAAHQSNLVRGSHLEPAQPSRCNYQDKSSISGKIRRGGSTL